MPSYRFYVRRFLNRRGHHAGAYVLASVKDTTRSSGSYIDPAAELEVADCARRISLEFPLHDAPTRRNSLAKARLLAEVTAGFAEALASEAELAARREAERPSEERRARRRRLIDRMVSVETVDPVPGLEDEDLARVMEGLSKAHFSRGAAIGGRNGTLGATMTTWSACRRDAPLLAEEAFRRALADVGVAYAGALRSAVE